MRRYSLTLRQIPWAVQVVYHDRRYLWAAFATAALSALGIGWAVQLVTYFPESGLFWDVTPLRLVQVLILAGTLGLLLPMQAYVLMKGRQMHEPSVAGKRRRDQSAVGAVSRTLLTVLSGGVGAVLGVACLVCCAPLLIPTVLAFLGTSGVAILSLNADLLQWSGWLFLASLVLGWLTLLLVAHNVTAACRLPSGTEKTEPSSRGKDLTGERCATESAHVQEV